MMLLAGDGKKKNKKEETKRKQKMGEAAGHRRCTGAGLKGLIEIMGVEGGRQGY